MDLVNKEVVKLYQTDNLSAQQIADKLNTSAYKVRKILSLENVSIRTISEAVTNLYITKHSYKPYVLKETLNREDELLKVAGVMLYWGEGAKRGATVALSNSNPALIKVFLRFLINVCGIDTERLHVSIHYYPDHNIANLTRFWSNLTGIPESQFYKPYFHSPEKGTYRTLSKYGTISVQYSDKKLLIQILAWMSEYESLGS